MAYITKSLIWLTVQNYLERNMRKSEAITEAANYLGLSRAEVYRFIYNKEPLPFNTRGYKCDPEWIDNVMEIIVHGREMLKRLGYIFAVTQKLSNPKLPVDHRKIESLVTLINQLELEIQDIIPIGICVYCADDEKQWCEHCGGYRWVSDVTTNKIKIMSGINDANS